MAWTGFQLLLNLTFPLFKKGHWRHDQSSFAFPVYGSPSCHQGKGLNGLSKAHVIRYMLSVRIQRERNYSLIDSSISGVKLTQYPPLV